MSPHGYVPCTNIAHLCSVPAHANYHDPLDRVGSTPHIMRLDCYRSLLLVRTDHPSRIYTVYLYMCTEGSEKNQNMHVHSVHGTDSPSCESLTLVQPPRGLNYYYYSDFSHSRPTLSHIFSNRGARGRHDVQLSGGCECVRA